MNNYILSTALIFAIICGLIQDNNIPKIHYTNKKPIFGSASVLNNPYSVYPIIYAKNTPSPNPIIVTSPPPLCEILFKLEYGNASWLLSENEYNNFKSELKKGGDVELPVRVHYPPYYYIRFLTNIEAKNINVVSNINDC